MEIIIRPVQSDGAKDKFTRHTLVFEVVKGIADPWVRQAEKFIHVVQQHRHDTGLPVMAVDNVRAFVRLQQEFESSPAEKGEPFGVVVMTVVNSSVKEVPV